MKSLILAAALTLSASAFAEVCEVDMVYIRTNRLIKTIRAFDNEDACKEAMKQCKLQIRLSNLLNKADCFLASSPVPDPVPTPRPGPTPRPDQDPYPDQNPAPEVSDSRRMLSIGESAIYDNEYVTILGSNLKGKYAVRSNDIWNTVTNNVRRKSLSVTNGCSGNLCTSDSVIDIHSAAYVKIVGISFDDTFVIQATDIWKTLSSNIASSALAVTTGCISSYYSKICVGDTVINSENRYSTIAGIQEDGLVVLRSSGGWSTLSTNIDPSSLVVTR
jgi:hypothetical protein